MLACVAGLIAGGVAAVGGCGGALLLVAAEMVGPHSALARRCCRGDREKALTCMHHASVAEPIAGGTIGGGGGGGDADKADAGCASDGQEAAIGRCHLGGVCVCMCVCVCARTKGCVVMYMMMKQRERWPTHEPSRLG